ncbi:YybH family protein [Streptosporangium sp. G11]|uniref:YybH family protein n=1 Tax=Streptosporangium sp. G11 TaxID=3436926 RepID=UPI003EBC4734
MSTIEDFELTDDAQLQTQLYVRAFNSGDFETLERLYTEEAIAVWEPGQPLSGQARRDHIAETLQAKPRMTAKDRHVYETGDATLLVVDWQVEIPGADGEIEVHTGVGLDVLRRGEDGKWRYAIDDPYGEEQ